MLYIHRKDDFTISIQGEVTKPLEKFLFKYFSYQIEGNKSMLIREHGFIPVTRLYNKTEQSLPLGMFYDLLRVLKANKIDYQVDPQLIDVNPKEWVEEQVEKFLTKDFTGEFEPFPHQLKAIKSLLFRKKGFGEIATSAGKSFIIYVLAGIFVSLRKKVLIITDSTNLVEQLKEDFLSYTKNESYWEPRIAAIHSKSKDTKTNPNNRIVISTYQSMKEPDEYFQQFDAIIVDEAHKATAPSITRIIKQCWSATYRIGMCGRLKGTDAHKWRITELFGQVLELITAKELIELGMATKLEIDVCRLERRIDPHFEDYRDYIEYLIHDKTRTEFIAAEAVDLDRNVIILFNRRALGRRLESTVIDYCETHNLQRQIEYIDGDITVDERMRIKDSFQSRNDVVLIASYKTISTGVNAPNLRAILMAEPMKSPITIVQSIGRVLRKAEGKDKATVIDYCDTYGWGLTHSSQRKRIYSNEKHHWSERTVKLL